MLISVARHAETGANRDRLIQGHQPGFLTEYGLKQAKRLGKRLEPERLDVIITSDLKRAVQTAKKIAKRHPDAQYIVDKRLREKGAGIYEGFPLGSCDTAALKAGVPTREFRPEGGESWHDVENRVKDFWTDLINRFGHFHLEEAHPIANTISFTGRDLPHVLIVTHTGFIHALMDHLSNRYSVVDRLTTTGVAPLPAPASSSAVFTTASSLIPPPSFTRAASPPPPPPPPPTHYQPAPASSSSASSAPSNIGSLLSGSVKHTALWTFCLTDAQELLVLRRNDTTHLKGLLKSSGGGPRVHRKKKSSSASPSPAPRSRTPTPNHSATSSAIPASTESLPGESASGSPTFGRSALQLSPPRVPSSPTQFRTPLRNYASVVASSMMLSQSPPANNVNAIAALRLSPSSGGGDTRNL